MHSERKLLEDEFGWYTNGKTPLLSRNVRRGVDMSPENGVSLRDSIELELRQDQSNTIRDLIEGI